MRERARFVFLLDVDNTLLDNDLIEVDLQAHLDQALGAGCRRSYWAIFEKLRAELGYADYLGALQEYRLQNPRDPDILEMSSFLIDYPFADRLYPKALEVIDFLRHFGTAVILSDGDAVFQPRKVRRSGIWKAANGRVLIYVHKERMLDDVEQKYPAEHYIQVDDKVRILAAMKSVWKERLTTVFVRQGHYAIEKGIVERYVPADLTIESIGDLMRENVLDPVIRKPYKA